MTLLPFVRRTPRPPMAPDADAAQPRLIPLWPGQREAVVEGGVVRGGRDLFAVMARAGQVLSASVQATEDNAAFEVFAPPGAGGPAMAGPALTGDDGGLQRWTGMACATGAYLISVGPTRGNATYRLRLCLT
jgi:hypothetical protein